MAVNPLSLLESLRPWRSAGLTHLLAPGRLEGIFSPDAGEGQSLERPGGFRAEGGAALGDGSFFAAENLTGNVFCAAGQGGGANSARPARSGPRPVFLPDNRPVPGPEDAVPGVFRSRPEAEQGAPALPDSRGWPEIWQAQLARTSPAPIVWTYAELGDDLTGRGDRERSACLRRLIASLRLPKGSSAFWPVSLLSRQAESGSGTRPPGASARDFYPEPADLEKTSQDSPDQEGKFEEALFFQAGLRRLDPRVVIMLGPQALELSGLQLSMSVPFTHQIAQGILFVLLPAFPSLLSTAAMQDRAGIFLRAAFAGISF